jgi:ribosomal peptide maturation radical SAM protein 1
MGFRQKSPTKVLNELNDLVQENGIKRFIMVDNIMPSSYFSELLPLLKGKDLDIFYEQKANINLEKMELLKAAGVNRIQPGIESLSTQLLQTIHKGTSARQNIMALRFARVCGVRLSWNLLYGFPEDRLEWYTEMAERVPTLQHLEPPSGLSPLSYDRFSPYFDRFAEFGIEKLEPVGAYRLAFPPENDFERVAYHFCAQSTGVSVEHPKEFHELMSSVERWRDLWCVAAPILSLVQIDEDTYLLTDTRDCATAFIRVLSRQDDRNMVIEHREHSGVTQWLSSENLIAYVDGVWIPLATAESTVLRDLLRE